MSNYPVFRCSICDKPLEDKSALLVCSYCQTEEEAEWTCPEGHYTCEACRLSTYTEIIEKVCKATTLEDPKQIADLIMHHPAFNFHGPEHHIIIAPVFITALSNAGLMLFDKSLISSIIKRTQDIPPVVCSLRGDCGACVGAGAALPIIARALSPSSTTDLRALALKSSALALLHLSELGGIRCCKQSIYATIETIYMILKDHLKLPIASPPGKTVCSFSHKIFDCKKEQCPYYE